MILWPELQQRIVRNEPVCGGRHQIRLTDAVIWQLKINRSCFLRTVKRLTLNSGNDASLKLALKLV